MIPELKLKDICSILNIYSKAPVFYNTEYVKNKCFNCKIQGRDCGIHIELNDINELTNKIKKNNSYAYESIMVEVYKVDLDALNKEIPDEVIFCVFCVLHEVGHWLDYQKSGLDGNEYREKYECEIDLLECEREKAISKASDNEKVQLMKKYDRLYRKTSCEKIADDYAKHEINGALTKLRESYKKTK